MKHFATLMITVAFFVSSPVLGFEMKTCIDPNPLEVSPNKDEVVQAKRMEIFFERHNRSLGFPDDLIIVPILVECTSAGSAAETIFVHGGFPELQTAFPTMALGPTYLVRVSRYLLSQEPTILEWVVIHELCHIKQRTAPASADAEERSRQEEWAERCVTEVWGEVAHAAAYTYLNTSIEEDLNKRFNVALEMVRERVGRIKRPW